ncbi:hypothetical protein SFRURICE_000382, partial [Spodoptera frugiperda]
VSLTVNRKLLKANPQLTSVTGDHHGVQLLSLSYVVVRRYIARIFPHKKHWLAESFSTNAKL